MSDVLPGLRSRRKAAGLSQTELAARVGATFQAVGAWERGETLPSADKLPEIARALGCSIDELFTDTSSGTGGASPAPTDDFTQEGTV